MENEKEKRECEIIQRWVLRGVLSTNEWESIDGLVNEYELCAESLKDDARDSYRGEYIPPTQEEILSAVFDSFEAMDDDYKKKVWDEVRAVLTKVDGGEG